MHVPKLIIAILEEQSGIWSLLKNTSGAFLGAFFAFIFFILGEKWKSRHEAKKEWEKTYKKEHAYLERYLKDLHVTLSDNKRILNLIIEGYRKQELSMLKLADLPIREGSSMKINDQLFINRIEHYIGINLKRLNRWQEGVSKVQDRLNEDLVSQDEGRKKSAQKSTKIFLEESIELIKLYDFTMDAVDDLILENRVLLKKYKKWRYNVEEIATKIRERKIEIENERMSNEKMSESALLNEYLDRLKKFGVRK